MLIRRLLCITLSALFTIFISITIVNTSSATTIDPILWEEFALKSDFIGFVECTTGGVIVAEYKVLESWKGAKEGETIRIKMSFDFWGSPFPLAQPGQKFFVMAFSEEAPSNMMSTTSAGPFPLWWRETKYDYNLPLWQGMVQLPLNDDDWRFSFGAKGATANDFKEFQQQVKDLLKKNLNEAEIFLLRRLFMKQAIPSKNSSRHMAEIMPDSPIAELAERLEQTDNSIEFIDTLWEFTKKSPDIPREVLSIISDGVLTENTLEHVEKLINEDNRIDAKYKDYTIVPIKLRIMPDKFSFNPPSPFNDVPDKERLDDLESALRGSRDDERFGEALIQLTKHRPKVVVNWLLKWTPLKNDHTEQAIGYGIGSYFARECSGDKKKHLRRLLKAKDPFVRVTAAVYLTYEDEKKGLHYLRNFQHIDGVPGIWAALNLARRGDKNAVTRILTSIDDMEGRQTSFLEGMTYGSLIIRTFVLLSNSAESSGIDGPTLDMLDSKTSAKRLIEWWKINKDDIVLNDPWLKELAELRVD